MNHHMLVHHRDIQNWVTARKGMPAIARERDGSGGMHPRLGLRFHSTPRPNASPLPVDDGLSPVSWKAWLAELDRQRLALAVSDEVEFEFVERETLQHRNPVGQTIN